MYRPSLVPSLSYQWSLSLIYQWNLEQSYQWQMYHFPTCLPVPFIYKTSNYALTTALDFSIQEPSEYLAPIMSNNRKVILEIVIRANRYIISHIDKFTNIWRTTLPWRTNELKQTKGEINDGTILTLIPDILPYFATSFLPLLYFASYILSFLPSFSAFVHFLCCLRASSFPSSAASLTLWQDFRINQY